MSECLQPLQMSHFHIAKCSLVANVMNADNSKKIWHFPETLISTARKVHYDPFLFILKVHGHIKAYIQIGCIGKFSSVLLLKSDNTYRVDLNDSIIVQEGLNKQVTQYLANCFCSLELYRECCVNGGAQGERISKSSLWMTANRQCRWHQHHQHTHTPNRCPILGLMPVHRLLNIELFSQIQ